MTTRKPRPWTVQAATTRLWNIGLDSTPQFRADIRAALRAAYRAGIEHGRAATGKPATTEGKHDE